MQLDSDCPGARCLTMYGLTLQNPKVSVLDLGWSKNYLLYFSTYTVYCVFVIFLFNLVDQQQAVKILYNITGEDQRHRTIYVQCYNVKIELFWCTFPLLTELAGCFSPLCLWVLLLCVSPKFIFSSDCGYEKSSSPKMSYLFLSALLRGSLR